MANPYAPPTPHSLLPSSSKDPPDPPITRSRTLFYLSVRDSSTFSSARAPRSAAAQYGDTVDVADDEQQGLLGPSSRVVHMDGLPPKWVDISDDVEDILTRVQAKVAGLDKLHAKHVLPGFTDRTAEEREIERQTADITRDFRQASQLVASITPGRGAPRVEVMTAKNVQRGLATRVQAASGQFRKKQRIYMQKLQGHAVKNKDLLAASGAIKLSGTEQLAELAEDEALSRDQLRGGQDQSQAQAQASATIDMDIQQRSQEINQIASSIAELADLFKDLGNLVVEQGTVLDSVEYNIQQTTEATAKAVDELEIATTYQSNAGKRKCILLLILIIVGLIIVLIYKPRRHSAAPVPDQGDGQGDGQAPEGADSSVAKAAEGDGVPLSTVSTDSAVTAIAAQPSQKPPKLPPGHSGFLSDDDEAVWFDDNPESWEEVPAPATATEGAPERPRPGYVGGGGRLGSWSRGEGHQYRHSPEARAAVRVRDESAVTEPGEGADEGSGEGRGARRAGISTGTRPRRRRVEVWF